MQRLQILLATTLAFLTISAAAPATPATEQETRNKLNDSEITAAVNTQLLLDEGVSADKVDVQTLRGVVTLSGTVDNLLARERAVKLTESVKGVRSIVNRLLVQPTMRTDTEIRREVNDALLSDSATESYEIHVTVDDSVVTLSGEVESWAEEQLCLKVAKGVRGVKEVEDEIEVNHTEQRSDYDIEQDIKGRLASDAWVDDALIHVNVENGDVTLSGTVGSAAEKTQAKFDAWVPGVNSVSADGLEVKWWARDDMRREQQYKAVSDAKVRQAVKDALFYDPRVNSTNVDVESVAGVVTLRGEVDSLQAKRAAKADAENTVGVWRAKNFLKVRPSPIRSDPAIAADVRSALVRNPYVHRYEIDVETINGTAYLSGSVHTDFEKQQAEEAASQVNGIIDVVNNLTVGFTYPEVSDWEIKEDIKDELFWSPFVDSQDISVTVDNGMATLSGTVDTWYEFKVAEESALKGGAVDVDNDLRVRFGPSYYGVF